MSQTGWTPVDESTKGWTPVAQDPLKTGAGMVAPREPMPLPEPKAGFLSAAGKTMGLTSTTDPGSEMASKATYTAEHPLADLWQGVKNTASLPLSIGNSLSSAVEHPIDTVEGVTGGPEFSEGLANKNIPQMAGALTGGLANSYGLVKGAQALPDLAEAAAPNVPRIDEAAAGVRDRIGAATRTPTGDLRTGTRVASSVAGGAGGAGAGLLTHTPYGVLGGAALGARYGSSLADALLPEHPYTRALSDFAIKPNEISTPLSKSPNVESTAKITAVRKATAKGAASEIPKGELPQDRKIVEPGSEPPPVNRTLVSYDRGDLLKMVQDSKTPYQDRVAYIRELRRNPGDVPKETIDNLSRYMVEPGAKTRIYGGPKK